MGVATGAVAALLAADFAYVVRRARREWRGGDLSRVTALLITSLWLLTAALLVLAVLWRPLPLEIPAALAAVAGGLVVAAGLALAAPGFVPFASVKQLYGVNRGGLITDGIYSYSRNPQYAGLGIALVGVAVAARSGLAAVVAALYWLAVRFWVGLEEEHLEAAFGEEYAHYRRRAPRFLGRREPPPRRTGMGA